MPTLISLSASKFYALKFGKSYIVTLEPVDIRPIKKNLIYTYRDVPMALIVLDFVWDKGSDDEEVFPTLDMIQVPKKNHGKGIGKQLFEAVLAFMKKRKVPELMFNNHAEGFWDSMDKNNVRFLDKRKRIGIIKY